MTKAKKSVVTVVAVLVCCFVLSSASVLAQGDLWLDGWAYRMPVAVSEPCGAEVTGYQVNILLDNTFGFAYAAADGSDVRVTDADGATLIPSWIETFDQVGEQASIWVKMPTIPIGGTTVYVYYGNPSPPGPEVVEVGPVGPWDKPDHEIVPIGGPYGGNALLAENIVYDDVTGHYWMVFANYNNGSVGLVYSDTPEDVDSWYWHGTVVTGANAPHIIKHEDEDGDLWCIFYADRSHSSLDISVDTCRTINGTYAFAGTMLYKGAPGSWEDYRVDEPYVFQHNDGTWYMLYMGDDGLTTEQVNYATAPDIFGPYTKRALTPWITFGTPGSFDAGTIADAWVVELHGVYYIGYTVSATKSSPWRTAIATTTDWITYEKGGVILDWGGAGDWDQCNAFRGAVTRFDDTYYFAYTGRRCGTGSYIMGVATQPAFMEVPINNADEVFEFIDVFDGDLSKWEVKHSAATGSDVSVAGGIATMTGSPASYVQMRAETAIGTGTLMESYARHQDAGLNPATDQGNTAAEVGYKDLNMNWGTDVIRIMDWPDLTYYCVQLAGGGASSDYFTTGMPFDDQWKTYRIYRTTTNTVEFQIDANPYEAFGPTYVSTSDIFPWFMSYSRSTAPQSRFDIDWVRVRKYCGADAGAVLGVVQEPSGTIYGTVTGGGMALYGVEMDLYDLSVDPPALVGTALTDNMGYYEFVDVPNGSYSVAVIAPLGYEPADPQDVDVWSTDVQVDFALAAMAMPMAQRGRGYWMHQVNAHLSGKGKTHESYEDMCSYMMLIKEHFNEHQLNPIDIFEVEGDDCNAHLVALQQIISPKRRASMSDKAGAHFTALLMNMVSLKLGQWAVISDDGATVSQAVTYCNYLLTDIFPDNDEMAKDIAEMINEGSMIPAGWIDLTTANYAYKWFGAIPETYALSQNYPNPFNPTTEIEFSLPAASRVSLVVFNIVGQQVAVLADGEFAAGVHSVQWDASSAASGVYLYRLIASDYVQTRKMVLLK